MPRTPTPRPAGEHLATLTRIVRQVKSDVKMNPKRSRKIRAALTIAIEELMREDSK